MLRAFFTGAMIGVLASLGYIFFGSWEFFSPEPVWAQILFAPGVFAGGFFYFIFGHLIVDHSLAVDISMGVGTLAMGAVCGGFSCVAYALVCCLTNAQTHEDGQPPRPTGAVDHSDGSEE